MNGGGKYEFVIREVGKVRNEWRRKIRNEFMVKLTYY
jgi:hypothetical protein